MSENYGRLGLSLHDALATVVPDPAGALDDILTLLQAMIRNACVNGGDGKCDEARNIAVLRTYLDKHQIKYQVHSKPDKPQRQNLIAEYGSGSPRVMLGPAHVDVVPVPSPDGGASYPAWDSHPFEGNIKDDKVYGRGAVDMLNTVAAQLVTFVHIVRARVPIRGTLLFCAVSDEENGGGDGVGYLLSDPALSHVFRADYTITEIGGASLLDRHLRPTNVIIQANSEKGSAHVDIICKGRGGHGSLPRNADSALAKAAYVISALHDYWTPTVVTEEWSGFVWRLDVPWVVRALLTCRPLLPWVIRLLLRLKHPLGPVAHALTRTSFSPNNVVVAGGKNNVVPGRTVVEVDVRTLPGHDEEYVLSQIRRALGRRISDDKDHYEVVMRRFTPATRSPVDTPICRAMEAAARALVPGCSFAWPTLPGATDSRFYRLTGTCSYGANLFEPSLDFGQLMKCFHGDNECISIRSLWQSFQFYMLSMLTALKQQ